MGMDENGDPVCEPLDEVNEVLQWVPPSFCNTTTGKLKPRSRNIFPSEKTLKRPGTTEALNDGPQILVCHDMCGGYLDDRYCQGVTGRSTAYRFYHWHLIDTFVYFSHRFVTIPPIGWIDAAHKHGVTVLGTVITEWETGAKRCLELLSSEDKVDQFTTRLAEIADFYHFDGWLINIENKIEPEHIPVLQSFMSQLTSKCHARLERPKVLWYDSVISSGELIWQDELNSQNRMFFEVCDGIFLNYCITKEKLMRSRHLAIELGRQFDVYAGVDVFGRSTSSGGGFNCREDLAMVLEQGLSCAIFAQGWVYEYLGVQDFPSNEDMFWGILKDLLCVRPLAVPFATSMCQGCGDKFYIDGQIVSEVPWQDMGLQQVQPSYTQSQFLTYTVQKVCLPVEPRREGATPEKDSGNAVGITGHVENSTDGVGVEQENVDKKEKETFKIEVDTHMGHLSCPKMEYDVTDAFLGGGSLKLSARLQVFETVLFRLFRLCVEEYRNLKVSVVWKSCQGEDDQLGFALLRETGDQNVSSTNIILGTQGRFPENQRKQMEDSRTASLRTWGFLPDCHMVVSEAEEDVGGNWKRSTFYVSSSLLGQGENGVQLLTLAAYLIKLSPAGSWERSTVASQIGHIHMCYDDAPDTLQVELVNGRCLQAQVTSTLDSSKVKQMISHPVFVGQELPGGAEALELKHDAGDVYNPEEVQSSSLKSQGIGLASCVKPAAGNSVQPNTATIPSRISAFGGFPGIRRVHVCHQSVNLTVQNDQSIKPRDDKFIPYALHLYRWKTLISEPDAIDYCLVYSYDESGATSFLGHTVSSSFVYKTDEAHPSIGILLYPILTSTGLPSRNVFLLH